MGNKVTHVISNDQWDSNFDQVVFPLLRYSIYSSNRTKRRYRFSLPSVRGAVV